METMEDLFAAMPPNERMFDSENECDMFLKELEEQNKYIARGEQHGSCSKNPAN